MLLFVAIYHIFKYLFLSFYTICNDMYIIYLFLLFLHRWLEDIKYTAHMFYVVFAVLSINQLNCTQNLQKNCTFSNFVTVLANQIKLMNYQAM